MVSGTGFAQEEGKRYDLVVLGATPGGIMSAVSAARQGKSCLLIDRNAHLGGLPANGLGTTDIATRDAVGGLFKEFVGRVAAYYRTAYGEGSKQYRDCREGFRFEPAVAERIFTAMIDAEPGITLALEHQFDSDPDQVHMIQNRIEAIRLTNRIEKRTIWVKGAVFIDATYEGDLIAAAGVPYVTGRESREEYDEPLAGKLYKYWEGPVGAGSDGKGDRAIQAYNYRLCLTRDPENRVPITPPEGYNREEYLDLVEDVITGRHAGKDFYFWSARNTQAYRNHNQVIPGEEPPNVPGDPQGIEKLFNISALPNGKYDANNQERALISSDLPEENWPWPEAGWEWRDAYAERLRNYTEGLLWFAGHDPSLPLWFREEVLMWGYAADEYPDNRHFPRQVYVREARRMKGTYFYTAHDALPVQPGERPPLHPNSVTAGHYPIDSHGVRKREEGRAHLDGFLSMETLPFTVPYGVLLPEKVTNLLSPVPVSGSHLGFSVLRMEPTWMALGQVAGTAAVLSLDTNKAVQEIDIRALQRILIDNDMVLLYYRDINREDPGFKALQWTGVHGLFTDWKAYPDKLVTDQEKREVSRIFEIPYPVIAPHDMSRAMLAGMIYRKESSGSVPEAAR